MPGKLGKVTSGSKGLRAVAVGGVTGLVALADFSGARLGAGPSFARSKRRARLFPIWEMRSSSARVDRPPLRGGRIKAKIKTRSTKAANLQRSDNHAGVC